MRTRSCRKHSTIDSNVAQSSTSSCPTNQCSSHIQVALHQPMMWTIVFETKSSCRFQVWFPSGGGAVAGGKTKKAAKETAVKSSFKPCWPILVANESVDQWMTHCWHCGETQEEPVVTVHFITAFQMWLSRLQAMDRMPWWHAKLFLHTLFFFTGKNRDGVNAKPVIGPMF